MTEAFSFIIIANAVYFISHVLRTLRFWLIYNDPKFSLSRTFSIMFATAALGFWIPFIWAEVIRLILFVALTRNVSRVLFSEIFTRVLDLVYFTLFLSFVGRSEVHPTLLILTLIGAVVFVLFLFASERFIGPLKNILITRFHSKWGLYGVKAADRFLETARQMSERPLASLALAFSFTLLIWTLDSSAVLILNGTSLVENLVVASEYWIHQSFSSLTRSKPITPDFIDHDLIRGSLFLVQAELAGLFAALSLLRFRKSKKIGMQS